MGDYCSSAISNVTLAGHEKCLYPRGDWKAFTNKSHTLLATVRGL